jgi:hypothetical protein
MLRVRVIENHIAPAACCGIVPRIITFAAKACPPLKISTMKKRLHILVSLFICSGGVSAAKDNLKVSDFGPAFRVYCVNVAFMFSCENAPSVHADYRGESFGAYYPDYLRTFEGVPRGKLIDSSEHPRKGKGFQITRKSLPCYCFAEEHPYYDNAEKQLKKNWLYRCIGMGDGSRFLVNQDEPLLHKVVQSKNGKPDPNSPPMYSKSDAGDMVRNFCKLGIKEFRAAGIDPMFVYPKPVDALGSYQDLLSAMPADAFDSKVKPGMGLFYFGFDHDQLGFFRNYKLYDGGQLTCLPGGRQDCIALVDEVALDKNLNPQSLESLKKQIQSLLDKNYTVTTVFTDFVSANGTRMQSLRACTPDGYTLDPLVHILGVWEPFKSELRDMQRLSNWYPYRESQFADQSGRCAKPSSELSQKVEEWIKTLYP